MREVLGSLKPDEAAADNHGSGLRPDGLNAGVMAHPGQEWRALFQPLADLTGVRHGPDREYPWKIDARQRRSDRRRSGGQNQLVIALSGDLASLNVF